MALCRSRGLPLEGSRRGVRPAIVETVVAELRGAFWPLAHVVVPFRVEQGGQGSGGAVAAAEELLPTPFDTAGGTAHGEHERAQAEAARGRESAARIEGAPR